MTLKSAVVLAMLFATTGSPLAAQAAQTDQPKSAVEQWQEDPTQIFDATELSIEDFRWLARPVVVFADTEADPRFRQQMELIRSRIDILSDRDVVVITDTDPSARSDARQALRPRGFMLALLSKDGSIIQRKPLPWDVREISRSIDKLPLRQQEIRSRDEIGG